MSKLTADQLRDEGVALVNRGDYAAAAERFEAAAHGYAAAGDSHQQAEMLNNIGVVRRHLRDYDGAREALTAAQGYFAAAGDRLRQGQARANLADLEAFGGDWVAAVGHYKEAAAVLAKAQGGEAALSAVWRALSVGHVRRRQWVPAMYAMEKSLAARRSRGLGGHLFLGLLRVFQRLFAGRAG